MNENPALNDQNELVRIKYLKDASTDPYGFALTLPMKRHVADQYIKDHYWPGGIIVPIK